MRHPAVDSGVDKYNLYLRIRPRHRQQGSNAKYCDNFKAWDCQNEEKINYLSPQIQTQSKLKPDVLQHYFFLIRYGFTQDFNHSNPLRSVAKIIPQRLFTEMTYRPIYMKKWHLRLLWAPVLIPPLKIYAFSPF